VDRARRVLLTEPGRDDEHAVRGDHGEDGAVDAPQTRAGDEVEGGRRPEAVDDRDVTGDGDDAGRRVGNRDPSLHAAVAIVQHLEDRVARRSERRLPRPRRPEQDPPR